MIALNIEHPQFSMPMEILVSANARGVPADKLAADLGLKGANTLGHLIADVADRGVAIRNGHKEDGETCRQVFIKPGFAERAWIDGQRYWDAVYGTG